MTHERSPTEEPKPPARRDDRPIRYGSAMIRRFGWFYRLLGLGWAMEGVRFEDHSAERIRDAASKGPVVYVLLTRSVLDHLALNTVLNRRRLPLSVWANGSTSFTWQPVVDAWRDVFARWTSRWRVGRTPDPITSGWLTRAVADGATVTVFLRTGDTAPTPDSDPLRAILDAQSQCERPIQLVPVIAVWDRAPENQPSAVRTFLLGSRETPSLFTKLRALYLSRGQQAPFVQVGEPLDLVEFKRRAAPARQLDSLRTLLRRFLKREGRVVRGPSLLPKPVIKSLVLDAPPMRRFAEEEAARTQQPLDKVRQRMSKEFDSIAASFSWGMIRFLSVAMKPVWTRVFSGYDIRTEDLERIRAASRGGTAVLVPCHKSHFDYLLLSWILFYDDLIVPHVVAGMNLAIWPVHYVLRASGGFFIKRSFAGERLHAKVFGRYLRELLLHGYTVEFFIEGGRTRTGRLLPPRLGVLDMVLEAAEAAPRNHEITLLPVAIAYEQVAEEQAYESELGGKEKTTESMGELLKARKVLMRRFGRVYIRIGDPIKASEAIGEGWRDLDKEAHDARLKATGERLVHRIGEAMVVLPTALLALTLLVHHRQGIGHADLMARTHRFRALLARAHALEAGSLERFDPAIAQALDRFVRDGNLRCLEGHERVWDIVPGRRTLLDGHKNQILHYVALPGLAAAAIRAVTEPTFQAEQLAETFSWLLRLLRRELVHDPDKTDADRLHAALATLASHGAIAAEGDSWRVADPARIGEVHGIVRSLLESYALVASAASRLGDRRPDGKALSKEILAAQEAWLSSGTATRPESFGLVNLTNAISVLVEDGALVKGEGGNLTAVPDLLAPMAHRLAQVVGS